MARPGNAVRVRRTGDRRAGTPASVPIRRIAGWAGIDGNPLRRGIDRVERALWIILVLGFFVAVPVLAPLAGQFARADSVRLIGLERSWREVSAVLLKRAPPQVDGYNSAATAWVSGRWRAPSGATRFGLVPTAPGSPAGTVVRMWVDHAGQFTGTRPLTANVIGFRVAAFEVLACVGLALAVLVLAALVRWLVNRRRMAHWAIEWACFGPRWSARHLTSARAQAGPGLARHASIGSAALLDHCWPWMVGFRA